MNIQPLSPFKSEDLHAIYRSVEEVTPLLGTESQAHDVPRLNDHVRQVRPAIQRVNLMAARSGMPICYCYMRKSSRKGHCRYTKHYDVNSLSQEEALRLPLDCPPFHVQMALVCTLMEEYAALSNQRKR